LGCNRVLLPKAAGALSAYGAQYSEIVVEFASSHFTRTGNFDFVGVNQALSDLKAKLQAFAGDLKERGIDDYRISFICEARYLFQVWEIDVPVPAEQFASAADLDAFVASFHAAHDRIFAVADPYQQVECLNWRGRLSAKLDTPPMSAGLSNRVCGVTKPVARREAYFAGVGKVEMPAYLGGDLSLGSELSGPAMILEPTTTIIVYPNARATVSAHGNYIVHTGIEDGSHAPMKTRQAVEA
jgi:N-methylhydantoinase A